MQGRRSFSWVSPATLAAALTGLVALPMAGCGGSDLPTGPWHPGTTEGSGERGSSGSGAASSQGSSASNTSSGSSGSVTSGGSSGSSESGSGSGGTSGGSSGGSSGSAASGSSGGGQQNPPTNVAVTLDQSSYSMQLLANSVVQVSVAPNGFTGSLQLAATGLPSGVTAAFAPPSLALDGSTSATAALTLTTATSSAPGMVTLGVTATSDGMSKSASAALTIESTITLHIPAGVNNLGGSVTTPITTAYGPYPIAITAPQGLSSSNPVTVYFMNDDSVSHTVHADAATQGFGHDPGSINPNSMDSYVRAVNTAGTYDFYLHDQGAPITIGRVVIQ